MAILELKNVCKTYSLKKKRENKYAVKDFNLIINDKEFIVLVGPSGCGKSTLLQMIAGLEEVSDGLILLDGVQIQAIPPEKRDMAMIFQSYALYPHMTVYENMAFALQIQHCSKIEIDERVRRVAGELGLSDYLFTKPDNLSGGERQRVAIGRAIVRNPKIFLMDEPLSNLDVKLRNQMRAEMIKLHKKLDTTFIYVTHDQMEAMTLGERIVVMKDGKIQQVGSPRHIYNNPENTFLASFIGTPPMNLINVKIVKTSDSDTWCIKWGNEYIQIVPEMYSAMEIERMKGKETIMGFRPEYASFSLSYKENYIPIKVNITELLGSELLIYASMNEEDIILKVPILSVPFDMRDGIPSGTQVYFQIMPEYVSFFDKETEKRICRNESDK